MEPDLFSHGRDGIQYGIVLTFRVVWLTPLEIPTENGFGKCLDGKIANRQSLAILDRGLKSQSFSQFCCIGVFKANRQSRVSNRSFNCRDATDSNRAF